MISRTTRIIFTKEMRETFRDHRVLLGVIVSPLLITPLLIAVFAFFVAQRSTQQQMEVLPVAGISLEEFAVLQELLEEATGLDPVFVANEEEAIQQIQERFLRAALVHRTSSAEMESGDSIGRFHFEILFDAANDRSVTARERLAAVLERFETRLVHDRIRALNEDPELLKPLRVTNRNLASETSVGGFLLGIILPYIVILGAAFGGMTSAFDLGAGEKEKGTMETLLVSPASRFEIILGKLFCIAVVSLVAAFFSIAGLVLAIEGGLWLAAEYLPAGIAISYTAVFAMILVVVPLSLLTAALLMVVSSVARNQKEAQAYVFPFMIVIIIPAMLSSLAPVESPLFYAFIPIFNTAMVMKQVLGSVFQPFFLTLAFLSSFVYAAVAAWLCTRLFQREAILFRT